jgi:tRNA A37 threonylcarbamoyladenosine synthetase subunit TsaC/SUA5/YrdC
MTSTSLAPDLLLGDPRDVRRAAAALADGGVVAQGFANFYVITTRPDAATVRGVNVLKGRPPHQVGSITTTPSRLHLPFDWGRLPAGLDRGTARDLMDALFALGPFGFRGPAADHVPAHLTEPDGPMRTTQVIAPGYRCPSNDFLAASLAATREDLLYITSANRSRHLTGADDEPAHYTAAGICDEFGHHPGFVVLAHEDEEAARGRYPCHDPMSTTILALHKLAPPAETGRPRLVVERHGSLPLDEVHPVVWSLGFDLVLGPRAATRLHQREYTDRDGER